MLHADNLTVTIHGKAIVKEASFRLSPSRLTVLLGKNGSGKTTLLGALAQLIPYTGSVLFNGASLAEMPRRERAKRIGVFPQILPSLAFTVRELAFFGRTPYLPPLGRPDKEDERAVESALVRCGVSHLANRALSSLSGGERQKAFLAMILAQKTDALLLDEPVTYLDPEARRDFYALLRQLCAEGKTVLAVLHELSEGMRIADDVLLLDEGRLLFAGERDALLQTELLESSFHVTRHTAEDGTLFFG